MLNKGKLPVGYDADIILLDCDDRWIIENHHIVSKCGWTPFAGMQFNAKIKLVVARGEIVGYSGNTGHTTGPHLHVSVYAGSAASVQKRPSTTCEGKVYTMPLAPTNAYLDPLYYLPKLF